MAARILPPRPDLDQLKRQAKELLKHWQIDSSATPDSASPHLRDAQRAIAAEYGFPSWDALQAHVERIAGKEPGDRPAHSRRRSLDYGDPIRDVVVLRGSLTRDVARQLAEDGVSGVKIDQSVPAESLVHLGDVPTLLRIDFSNRGDLTDEHVSFLERLPDLIAVSFNWCQQITDAAVSYLRHHQHLERINLDWTRAGDGAVDVLAGKPALARVLVGNRLTDKGAARLRDFPALAVATGADTFLSISSARELTDAALAEIGNLNGVAALDVHTSAFGSPFYTARGVSHLKAMASLQELNFHGQLVTDAVLTEIAAIPHLRHLHSQDMVSGDEGFIALGRCATLEVLSGRHCHRVTDRGFAAIARLPRLRSLGLGGRRLTDGAMAFLADSPTLEDLGPILFGDAAFAHIARIPNLQRLTNMYNRATTDAATRHLQQHQTLVHYSAFGTQITDDSLRILAGCPRLETLEFENCAAITDTGLRELTRLPRLRRISAWSCINVEGTWTTSAPSGVEARSEAAPPEQSAGYRAETLIDYPDMPVGISEAIVPGLSVRGLPPLACFGLRCASVDDALRLSVDPGMDTRWIGVLTQDAFAVPLRIELAVKPIHELRLVFGAHNRVLTFDEHGNVQDPAPWFMRTTALRGTPHPAGKADGIRAGDWARVSLEVSDREKRLFVDGHLRHTWQDDFADLRSRIGIGLRKSELSVRELKVTRI